MNDNAPVALLNDTRKHSKRRRQTGISSGEHVDLGTFEPSLVSRDVDDFLHILAIEVNRG